MWRFQFSTALAGFLLLGVCEVLRADVIHAFTGEIAYILYGDGTTVDLDDPADVAASNNAGMQLQSSLGLNWVTQGLGITIRAHVPESLNQQYPSEDLPDWRRYESGSSSINWSISSSSDSVMEDGGPFSADRSTVLVWDNIFDNPDGVDRYTVNSAGTVNVNEIPDAFFDFEIGLWENGSDGTLPGTFDFGADPPASISNYYPDLTQIFAGTDTIRNYMTYTQGLLVEGSDEYWAKTFDAVLSVRQIIELPDGSTTNGPTFMAGITFNRVPEPSSLVLIIGSMGMMIGYRFNRKQ
jgi:hypothetical protein